VPPRFNPPPGWPAPPAGWSPPPGWQPDPAWPAPPPGWPLWVEEPQVPPVPQGSQSPGRPLALADARWTIGGAAAIFLGSFLPWISNADNGDFTVHINGGAQATSAIFGLIAAGLGAAIYTKSARGAFVKPGAYGFTIPLLVLSILGILGYGIFAIAGVAGFQETDALGDTGKVTFSPSVGLILLILGCLAVLIGSIRVQRHAARRRTAAAPAPASAPGTWRQS
jgi:hypothetical protein